MRTEMIIDESVQMSIHREGKVSVYSASTKDCTILVDLRVSVLYSYKITIFKIMIMNNLYNHSG